MREILFRGKRCDNGEWVQGHYNYANWYLPPSMKIVDTTYHILPIGHGDSHKVAPETVGQFTGLTDKNGQKIFEGDICRNTRTGEIVSVKWHGTMAGYVWSKPKPKSHLFDFGELFRAYDKYEVIGNIHDNPELLEVQDG